MTGLTTDSTYYFMVRARSSEANADQGPYSDPVSAMTVADIAPDAPVVTITQGPLENTADGDVSDLMVEWEVADDGGAEITAYVVMSKVDTGDAVVVPLDSETDTEVTIENIAVGSVVVVTVTATNIEGTSEAGTARTSVAAPDPSTLTFTDTTIKSDSTSGGAAPEFTLTILSLPGALAVGSSIVLYLEDDYQEPDSSSIPASSIYFVADQPPNEVTGNGARVYATRAAAIDTDDYFDPTKSDISIRVFIPDMCTTESEDCQSANGPARGQRLQMVIEDTSGIKNPTEAGNHSADFRVLGPTGSVPSIGPAGGDAAHKGIVELLTAAKVGLSDNNNKRGYELIVTGTGYNDDTTATAYVLTRMITAAEWWDSLDCPQMITAVGMTPTGVAATDADNSYCKMYAGLDAAQKDRVQALFAPALVEDAPFGVNGCGAVVANGTAIGTATIGSDDTAAIPVTVSVPTFKPGKSNYICVSDGESRGSGSDVEVFELEDSIRVVPTEVNAGDTVTLFAEDFMSGLSFTELKLGGVKVYMSDDEEYEDLDLRPDGIGNDGSATITFVMPPTIDGNPIKGTIRVDGKWTSTQSILELKG